ncbi:hypothetical protein [Bradyrhizobium sp. LHD-71]|uniref:hypothetical protein n=1 Tax=Bradyrhizobium sp. LHD-71 TaxID=3072141 RepID=UPI00281076D2|nr:hypothetical protein [Bradyrhizobium sp. LHD-71]MDQ8729494.1 hypothetical protein [Bradyrhizobium sp. LHD-71]
MRDDIHNPRDEAFFTPGVIAAMLAAVFLAAALFLWAPWGSLHLAGDGKSGMTTGQSPNTTRMAPPATAPAPAPDKK